MLLAGLFLVGGAFVLIGLVNMPRLANYGIWNYLHCFGSSL